MDGKNRLLPRRGCVFHGQHLRWIVCNSGFCRGVIHQRDLHSSMDCLDCCYGERHCIGDMPHISERNSGCSNNQAISCGDSSIICSVLCQIGIDEASAYVSFPGPMRRSSTAQGNTCGRWPIPTALSPIGRCSSAAWTGFTTTFQSSTWGVTPASLRVATTPVRWILPTR